MAQENTHKLHLDWTHKQGRILTANGKANEYYVAERGYPFTEDELPHFHLMKKTTHQAFAQFQKAQAQLASKSKSKSSSGSNSDTKFKVPCGAWKRPLFMGAWEHSTSNDEHVYNIQTNTLFIDLRIPTTISIFKPTTFTFTHSCFNKLSDLELRLYARQHAFAGFTVFSYEKNRHLPIGTRHHCIDWNFVGVPRTRPNKWFIEMKSEPNSNSNCQMWKEWAYAKDHHDQHYYMERWERLNGDENGDGLVLAMRKAKAFGAKQDGVLVVVGKHFNYIHDRIVPESRQNHSFATLVDLVDTSLQNNDRATAEPYLRIDAGHGIIQPSGNWIIDCAIQSWRHGTSLFHSNGMAFNCPQVIEKEGSGKEQEQEHDGIASSCQVLWNNEKWDIIECNLESAQQLSELFHVKTDTIIQGATDMSKL